MCIERYLFWKEEWTCSKIARPSRLYKQVVRLYYSMLSSTRQFPRRAPSLWPLADLSYSLPPYSNFFHLFSSLPMVLFTEVQVYPFLSLLLPLLPACVPVITYYFRVISRLFPWPWVIKNQPGFVPNAFVQGCIEFEGAVYQVRRSRWFRCSRGRRRAGRGSIVAAAVCEVCRQGCCGSHMTCSLHTAAFEAPELFTLCLSRSAREQENREIEIAKERDGGREWEMWKSRAGRRLGQDHGKRGWRWRRCHLGFSHSSSFFSSHSSFLSSHFPPTHPRVFFSWHSLTISSLSLPLLLSDSPSLCQSSCFCAAWQQCNKLTVCIKSAMVCDFLS